MIRTRGRGRYKNREMVVEEEGKIKVGNVWKTKISQ